MKLAPLITNPQRANDCGDLLTQYSKDRLSEGLQTGSGVKGDLPFYVYTGDWTGRGLKNYIKSLGGVSSVFLFGDLPAIGYSDSPDDHFPYRRCLGDYYLVTDEDCGWLDDNTAQQNFLTKQPYCPIGRLWFEGLPNVTNVTDAYRRWLMRRHEMAYWRYPIHLDWVNHLQGHDNCEDADILRQMGSLSQIARRLGQNIVNDGAYGNDGTWDTQKTDGAQAALYFSGGSEFESAFYYIGTDGRLIPDSPKVMFATFFGSYLCDYYAPGNLLRTYLSLDHGLLAAYNHYNNLPVYRLAEGWSWGQVCLAGRLGGSPLANLLGDPS
jgi:hypothetical protein